MQHTLLPPAERHALRREYRRRVLIVGCFMVSVAILVGIGALFPAFMRARLLEQNERSTAAALQKDKDQSGAGRIENELAGDAALVSAVSGEVSTPRLSAVLQSLASARGSAALTSFELERTGSSTVSITIEGMAPTRAALLSFKSRLEELAPGNKVELPISNLEKSANVQFSLRLTEKLP